MNGFKVTGIVVLCLISPTYLWAHELSPVEKQAILEGSNSIYLWLGAKHMLTGVEHLLFVFGIVCLLQRFIDVLKYITAFTVAHSFTLAWATFYDVHFNYVLVDAAIALSVLYIAMANLDAFRKVFRVPTPNMFICVIIFGLIHGFGLSERLMEFPLSNEDIIVNTLLFNVGVEFGQIVILSCILIWLSLFRKSKSFGFFNKVSNYGLIAMSFLLFFIQISTYHLGQWDESFGTTVHANSVVIDEKEVINFRETLHGAVD